MAESSHSTMTETTEPGDSNSTSPRSGHLGTAWEVALVAVFITVFACVIGVAVYQVRRRRARGAAGDEESGTSSSSTTKKPPHPSSSSSSRKSRRRDRDQSRSSSKSKSLKSSSRGTNKQGKLEKYVDEVEEEEELDDVELEKGEQKRIEHEKFAPPSSSSSSSSESSREDDSPPRSKSRSKHSDHQQKSTSHDPIPKPVRYYWDHR